MTSPTIVSLVASAALGDAILFLTANSEVSLSCRRVALVRELSRVEVRRALGLHEGDRVPQRLLARESAATLSDLCRAASYGTRSAIGRYYFGGNVANLRRPAA
ncbi:MAG: hypothetical protein ACRENA_13940 [Vulcanimicrobiaceae bacterium]